MENFNEIINGKQLTLVDFFATWCGPCKMMHPVLEQLKENFGDSIRILKIDVDKAQELAMSYRIQSVPTLMLFREGQQLWRQSGAMPLAELTNIINSDKQSHYNNSGTLWLSTAFAILRERPMLVIYHSPL